MLVLVFLACITHYYVVKGMRTAERIRHLTTNQSCCCNYISFAAVDFHKCVCGESHPFSRTSICTIGYQTVPHNRPTNNQQTFFTQT